jgi:flagellar protein FliS
MTPTPPALAYRRAATQQASVAGIVLALCDTLHGDLRRAVLAMQQGNIEERCRQLKHGFSVLTQLDTLIDMERGGQTAINLRNFYAYLRQEMLHAQFKQEPSILDRASVRLASVRAAWQQVDARSQTEVSPQVAGSADSSSSPVDFQA